MTRLAICSNNSVDKFPIVNNECCKVLCTSVSQEAEEMSQEEVREQTLIRCNFPLTRDLRVIEFDRFITKLLLNN